MIYSVRSDGIVNENGVSDGSRLSTTIFIVENIEKSYLLNILKLMDSLTVSFKVQLIKNLIKQWNL